MEDEIKIGARNSRSDQKRIQDAHDLLVENGAVCQSGKALTPDEVLIFIGGEVKALEGGKVGGYLTRFTSPDDPDLTGDFFTKDTDFGDAASSPVLYQHGMDVKMGRRKIGAGTLAKDDVGVWIDAQLDLRDQYEKAIYELAKAGKLGWSSGTAGHLVERQPVGKAQQITRWPLGLDASLTPTPAEPRNSAVSLKSLLSVPEVGGDPTATAANPNPIEVKKMELTELEVKNIVAAALAEQTAAAKAAELKAAELKAAEDAGYKKAVDEIGKKFPHFAVNTQPLGFSEEKDAVPAFKAWVATGQVNGGLIAPDYAMKTAFNIADGATGGYLVPDPLYAQIVAKRNLASWVRQAPVQRFQTPSDHVLVPVEDTSHTAFVETAENAAYDENEGTIAQIDLALKKYTKLEKMSEEFVNYQGTNFDSWLVQALARAEAVTENTLATAVLLDASGATAATAAASQTALTIAEIERLIGSLGAGWNVASECGFVMKNATKYYLKGVALASYQMWEFDGYPVYISDDMPAMTAGLYSTVFGNFSAFALAERPGMLVQRNPYLYMATGQIGIFANIFRAYDVLQSEAFYKMAQAS